MGAERGPRSSGSTKSQGAVRSMAPSFFRGLGSEGRAPSLSFKDTSFKASSFVGNKTNTFMSETRGGIASPRGVGPEKFHTAVSSDTVMNRRIGIPNRSSFEQTNTPGQPTFGEKVTPRTPLAPRGLSFRNTMAYTPRVEMPRTAFAPINLGLTEQAPRVVRKDLPTKSPEVTQTIHVAKKAEPVPNVYTPKMESTRVQFGRPIQLREVIPSRKINTLPNNGPRRLEQPVSFIQPRKENPTTPNIQALPLTQPVISVESAVNRPVPVAIPKREFQLDSPNRFGGIMEDELEKKRLERKRIAELQEELDRMKKRQLPERKLQPDILPKIEEMPQPLQRKTETTLPSPQPEPLKVAVETKEKTKLKTKVMQKVEQLTKKVTQRKEKKAAGAELKLQTKSRENVIVTLIKTESQSEPALPQQEKQIKFIVDWHAMGARVRTVAKTLKSLPVAQFGKKLTANELAAALPNPSEETKGGLSQVLKAADRSDFAWRKAIGGDKKTSAVQLAVGALQAIKATPAVRIKNEGDVVPRDYAAWTVARNAEEEIAA